MMANYPVRVTYNSELESAVLGCEECPFYYHFVFHEQSKPMILLMKKTADS